MTLGPRGGGWTRGRRLRNGHIVALSLAVASVPLLDASVAWADDLEALDQARAPYDAGQYAEAHDKLAGLVDPKLDACETATMPAHCRLTSPDLIERARALDAASLLALNRTKEADESIATILRANPSYVPSPAMFPQTVVDRFTFVRGSMAAELRKIVDDQARDAEAKRLAAQKARDDQERWIGEVQRLAAREPVARLNSRWVALVPFGVGQFQNGDTAGGIGFAVTEALAGGTSLVYVALSNQLVSSVTNMPSQYSAAESRLSIYAIANRISFATWGALTVAGIIHAEVTFVPERVTLRDRPVPPRPKLVPIAGPLVRGGILGMAGTF